jgi:hypothetical protein
MIIVRMFEFTFRASSIIGSGFAIEIRAYLGSMAVALATAKARRRRALQNVAPSCRSAISANTLGAVSAARRDEHVPRSDDGGDDTDEEIEAEAEAETAAEKAAEAAAVDSAATGSHAVIAVLEDVPADAAAAAALADAKEGAEKAEGDADAEEAASVLVRIEVTPFAVGAGAIAESSKLSCSSAS